LLFLTDLGAYALVSDSSGFISSKNVDFLKFSQEMDAQVSDCYFRLLMVFSILADFPNISSRFWDW